MKISAIIAIGALGASVSANAHIRHLDLHKRQTTKTIWEKVVVTKTVTLLPGQLPPTHEAEAINSHTHDTHPVEQKVQAQEDHQAPKDLPKAALVPATPSVSKSNPAPEYHPQTQPQPKSTNAPTYVPPPTSTAAPAPESTAASSGPSGGACGSVGGKCSGDVTMYNDQGAGACGWTNDTNSDEFFALAIGMFGTYTNNAPGNLKNAYCGRTANIIVNGKTITGTLTDACGGCTGQSIDLSNALWDKAYPGQAGTRYSDVEWYFTDEGSYHGGAY